MSTPLSPPPNVIFLDTEQRKTKEEIIADYIDILVSCKKADEFYQCLSMLYEDAVMATGKLIIEKQILKNVEILEELRN